MKKIARASAVMVFSTILFTGSFAQAGPMQGDEVTLDIYVPQHKAGFNGGAFLLESTNPANDYSFVSFCLEKKEYFTPGSSYIIDSIADYAENNHYYADQFDYISNATKWLMNEYTFNYDSLSKNGTTSKGEFAKLVQETIWYFEDEPYTSVDSTFLSYIKSEMGIEYSLEYNQGYLDNIKVANIVSYYDGDGIKTKEHHQSQLIANPVPEPATMLLFGTGMAGLAALRRKKK